MEFNINKIIVVSGVLILSVIVFCLVFNAFDQSLRRPDYKLNWVDMKLTDKQITTWDGIIEPSEPRYHMIFNSAQYGTLTYDAMSADEYSSHEVGKTYSVGLNELFN